jgi:Matrixin
VVQRRMFPSSALATVALVGSAVLAVPASAGTGATPASWCTPGATVSASTAGNGFSAAECAAERLTIVSGPAAVRLPARGETISAEVLTTRGSAVLTVARDGSGNVTIATAAPQRPALALSACSSSGYTLLGYHVRGSYTWSYDPANAPRSVSGVAASTLRAATSDITNGRNDCGLRTKPRTAHRYAGTTGSAPGINAAAQCAGNDGRSVTGWKPLTARGVLAVTCTYVTAGVVAASDAAINTRFAWSVSAAHCRNAYDLKGVMTHERGHTFGLGHSTADPGLTMYPSVPTCDFSKSTLGRGDLLGLIRIYGAA